MKSLLTIILTLCSFAVFSAERNAVDSLLSVLPEGNHSGSGCSVNVSVSEYPVRSVFVNVANDDKNIFKIVSEDSEFMFREYKKEFIQADLVTIDDTRSASLERIIRTVNAGENQLYVVVAEAVIVNRDRREDAADCVAKINK